MRLNEIIPGDAGQMLEARRPFLLRSNGTSGSQTDVPVYENPSPDVLHKLIRPGSAERAIIYQDGRLYLWSGDLVHADVRSQLAREIECLSLYLTPTAIFVWGDEHQEGTRFEDPRWLRIIQANPTIRRTYGDDIEVIYDSWV